MESGQKISAEIRNSLNRCKNLAYYEKYLIRIFLESVFLKKYEKLTDYEIFKNGSFKNKFKD